MKQRLSQTSIPILVLLGLAGWALVVEPGPAQQESPGGFTETIEVELVNVEARVVDAEGRPVTGLTAEDFAVLHDGQPVEITNLTEFREGQPAGSAMTMRPGQATAADHHLIVYFDDLHLAGSHRRDLVAGIGQFIAEQRIPSERIMILRQGAELNIEAPFGSSEESLRQALQGLTASPAGRGSEAAIQQALDEIQRTWNQSRDATSSGERAASAFPGADASGALPGGPAGSSPRDATMRSPGAVSQSCEIFDSRVEAILSGWMQQRSRDISVTLASLTDSVAYLAGLPGTKSLLYLSDSLETMPGLALSNYADTICPGGQQSRPMKALGEELESAYYTLARHAAANRVAIYSLQGNPGQTSRSGGARDSGVRSGSMASFEASRRADDESGLILLAEQTGGHTALLTTDYQASLRELATDMVNYYSMAFRAPGGQKVDNHEIEIRMRDSALQARFRRAYTDKSADQTFSEKLQGALYLGLVDNPLEARLAADEFREGAEGRTVMPLRVVLPVQLVSFVPEGDHLMGSILVRVMSRDVATGATGRLDRPFKVKHDPNSPGEWMQLPVEMELTPGAHMMAIGVLDQESGMTSLVSTTIEVPAL